MPRGWASRKPPALVRRPGEGGSVVGRWRESAFSARHQAGVLGPGKGLAETAGKRGESFVVRARSELGAVECGKLVMALDPHALPLADITAPAAAGTRGSGLCLLE